MSILPLLLLCLLLGAAEARAPPPVLELPLYRGYYITAQVGNDGGNKLLRLRFDEDKIVLFGSPSGGTYDEVAGTERLMLGPAVVLQLPVLYTYQGNPSVSDPIATNLRVTYQGILGLGPGSPLWDWYSSWMLERSFLYLGRQANAQSNFSIAGMRIDPASDFSYVSHLPLYQRWARTLGAGGADPTADQAYALALLEAAGGGQVLLQSSSALSESITVKEYAARSNHIDRVMVVQLAHDYGIELDAYTIDSTGGYPIELLQFRPPMPSSNNNNTKKRDMFSPISSVLTVGLIHARDHIISADAFQSSVFLSPSNSGPFRARQVDYTWAVFALVILSLIHVPGLSDWLNRVRNLHMPEATQAEYEAEIARGLQNWTLLHLITRWALVGALWITQFSLVAYRSAQDFEPIGWAAAYWGSFAYVLLVVLFAPVRYPDRTSVTRFTCALYLCACLLLMTHFEDSVNACICVLLAFMGFRLVAVVNVIDWIRPDDPSNRILPALVSSAETIFFGWFAGFYVLHHIARTTLPGAPAMRLVEAAAVTVVWMRGSFLIVMRAESARLAANMGHISTRAREVAAAFVKRQRELVAARKNQIVQKPETSSK